MPQPDKSTVSAGPADDARYLRCSAAANIAFASARVGVAPPAGAAPPARAARAIGQATPGSGMSEGGEAGGGGAAGSEAVRQFEVEELPSEEGTDTDA